MIRDNINRLYSDNDTMDAIIDAVQPEIDKRNAIIRYRFNDVLPATATDKGILMWEQALGITASPSTETIDFRRERILNRLSSSVPYTERMLQELLSRTITVTESPFAGTWRTIEENIAYWGDAENAYDTWGDLERASEAITSAWSYILDYRNYRLDIYMYRPSRNWVQELTRTLQQMIPLNIAWKIYLSHPLWSALESDFERWEDIERTYNIWNDIEEGYEND